MQSSVAVYIVHACQSPKDTLHLADSVLGKFGLDLVASMGGVLRHMFGCMVKFKMR